MITAGGAAGDDGDVSVSVAAITVAVAVAVTIGVAADGLLADGSTIRKPFETFILRKLSTGLGPICMIFSVSRTISALSSSCISISAQLFSVSETTIAVEEQTSWLFGSNPPH